MICHDINILEVLSLHLMILYRHYFVNFLPQKEEKTFETGRKKCIAKIVCQMCLSHFSSTQAAGFFKKWWMSRRKSGRLRSVSVLVSGTWGRLGKEQGERGRERPVKTAHSFQAAFTLAKTIWRTSFLIGQKGEHLLEILFLRFFPIFLPDALFSGLYREKHFSLDTGFVNKIQKN